MFAFTNDFLNKASQLDHNICMSCIILCFLNNAFYLAYTISMPFIIGLRPFHDAHRFQFANVSITFFLFLISSLLKLPTGSLTILIEFILMK